jgi:hypothetical protein
MKYMYTYSTIENVATRNSAVILAGRFQNNVSELYWERKLHRKIVLRKRIIFGRVDSHINVAECSYRLETLNIYI